VFRIHNILVWIRIRILIRGSMPLTNGSGSGVGSFYFHHWPSRCEQKTNFKKVFLHSTFLRYFTSFFKDKMSKRSHKTVEIKVFLTIFCLMIEGSGSGAGSGSIPLTSGSGSGSLWPKNMWIRIRLRIRIRNTALEIPSAAGHCFPLAGGFANAKPVKRELRANLHSSLSTVLHKGIIVIDKSMQLTLN
jgi:hypothetical protein